LSLDTEYGFLTHSAVSAYRLNKPCPSLEQNGTALGHPACQKISTAILRRFTITYGTSNYQAITLECRARCWVPCRTLSP